jgi:hypothetical protein
MSWKDTVPNHKPTLSRGGGESKVATNHDDIEYRKHTSKDSSVWRYERWQAGAYLVRSPVVRVYCNIILTKDIVL